MLEDLNIKDFALIEEVNLEFTGGLTVLTGETGAGKSILIGALSFLLGGKADVDVIRAGCEEALVSGTFTLDLGRDRAALQWLSDAGISPENNRVLLRRVVRSNGKTGSWIQGRLITRAELAVFAGFLVDIHGQHDHQSLLRVAEHRPYLDSYAGITAAVTAFTGRYVALVEKRKQRAALTENAEKRAEHMEILNFAIQEIEGGRFKADEEASLVAEEARLAGFEKLHAALEGAAQILDSGGGNLAGLAKQLHGCVAIAAASDKALSTLDKRAEAVFYEVSDMAAEIRSYLDRLVFDQGRFEEVQERLATIYKLKKKYTPNGTLADLIAYGEKARADLEALSRGAENRAALDGEIAALEKEVLTKAKDLSVKRTEAANKMAAAVAAVLSDLGMKGTAFTVAIIPKPGTVFEQQCGPHGIDDVEFLISANPGSPERPLAKIASGGELSRVMLALKTVLAASDTRGTLVFDEIDTGIGGEVAIAVGKHLKGLAAKQQIFCITHLASIAVYADTHSMIQKSAVNGTIATRTSVITGEARVAEIARMLAGDAASPASMEHARSLLEAHHA
jgi:DNA repair protein RecN (Recombination protein N)